MIDLSKINIEKTQDTIEIIAKSSISYFIKHPFIISFAIVGAILLIGVITKQMMDRSEGFGQEFVYAFIIHTLIFFAVFLGVIILSLSENIIRNKINFPFL